MKTPWITAALVLFAVTATAEPVGQRHSIVRDCLTSANVWDKYGNDALAGQINDDILDEAISRGLQLSEVRLMANGKCNYYYTRPLGETAPHFSIEVNKQLVRTHWVACNDDLGLGKSQTGQISYMNDIELMQQHDGFRLAATLEPQSDAMFCTQIYVKTFKPLPEIPQIKK